MQLLNTEDAAGGAAAGEMRPVVKVMQFAQVPLKGSGTSSEYGALSSRTPEFVRENGRRAETSLAFVFVYGS